MSSCRHSAISPPARITDSTVRQCSVPERIFESAQAALRSVSFATKGFTPSTEAVCAKDVPHGDLPGSIDCDSSGHSTPGLERGSETVILVEDQDTVRRVICDMLRAGGYRVLPARLPAEALTLAREFEGTIDLLITDVILPQMSGPELASAITSTHSETKVLFMSGYVEQSIGEHAGLAADAAFIQKPFTPDALLRKVREVLDKPSNRVA